MRKSGHHVRSTCY